jgi:hypothetical protein
VMSKMEMCDERKVIAAVDEAHRCSEWRRARFRARLEIVERAEEGVEGCGADGSE